MREANVQDCCKDLDSKLRFHVTFIQKGRPHFLLNSEIEESHKICLKASVKVAGTNLSLKSSTPNIDDIPNKPMLVPDKLVPNWLAQTFKMCLIEEAFFPESGSNGSLCLFRGHISLR